MAPSSLMRPSLRPPHRFGVALATYLLLSTSLSTSSLVVAATASSSERNASERWDVSSTSAPPPHLPSPLDLPVPRPPRPVVLWHGMGDSCCSPHSMGALSEAIRKAHPGTHVLSLDTSFDGRAADGRDATADVLSSFFGDVNAQVDESCRVIRDDEAIARAGEFDAVGFSQGGLFLRALVQRCGRLGGRSGRPRPFPRAVTLVTLGSPHQGVTAFPSCSAPTTREEGGREGGRGDSASPSSSGRGGRRVSSLPPSSDVSSAPSLFCRAAEALISRGAFAPGIRERVVQAQYFKVDADPKGDEGAEVERRRYLELNPFLPRVNGEVSSFLSDGGTREGGAGDGRDEGRTLPSSPSRPRPLASLHQLVLFRFEEDTVVVPRDSSWFSELRGGRVVPLRETPLYKEDVLGLRELDERETTGRSTAGLLLKTAPGNHMRLTVDWFVDEVVRPFLNKASDSEGGQVEREDELEVEVEERVTGPEVALAAS